MNDASETSAARSGRAGWIAAGFLGAFAASIGTVIFTGLNVEGSRATIDAGFRQVTMVVGETRQIDLAFEADRAFGDAMLELVLPDAVRLTGTQDQRELRIPVSLVEGDNTIPVEIEAAAQGAGYLYARVAADETVDRVQVFLTVTAE